MNFYALSVTLLTRHDHGLVNITMPLLLTDNPELIEQHLKDMEINPTGEYATTVHTVNGKTHWELNMKIRHIIAFMATRQGQHMARIHDIRNVVSGQAIIERSPMFHALKEARA